MSDMGEKTCPLCAEEMDLTDQQLKPCKCGYQVCVWCWHQIIDMAEKDETEGRCPACRSPYDKQKIVGTAANCERMVSEVNLERRKSQKTKPKPSEARKQLSSVRVIQRNLVYVVGLPLDLADEDSLQRKEYFGQYGRVLKVSMSRTATGVVQQFPNNTCSVYITYSTEEEAVRCIQSLHGFVLDGRSLKACFGTTKYCHAWLRNVPCTNRDCLYLHELGQQEDSFTKDEIISAYTRSRVQQITGVTHHLQQRSGIMLPPPLYDHCNESSPAKPFIRKASNNIPSVPKSSPPDGTSRSVTLPAAASWGTRSLNQLSATNSVCSSDYTKQKPDAGLSAGANPIDVSVSQNDVLKKPTLKENVQILHTETKQGKSEKPSSPNNSPASIQGTSLSASASTDKGIVCSMALNVTNFSDHSQKFCISTSSDGNTRTDEKVPISGTHGALMSTERISSTGPAGVTKHKILQSDCAFTKLPGKEVFQRHCDADNREVSALQMSGEAAVLSNEGQVSRSEYVARTDSETLVGTNADSEIEEDILSFNSQRHKDPEITSCSVPRSANFHHVSNHMASHLSQYSVDLGLVDSVSNSSLFASSGSDRAQVPFDKAMNVKQSRPFLGDSQVDANVDTIEDNIIASILSLDLDESSNSPRNLASLFRETERETSSLRLPQGNNQSRFSFARQEESNNQAFESYDIFSQRPDRNIFYQNSVENRDTYSDKLGGCNGVSPSYFTGSDNLASSPTVFLSNKLSKVSRAPAAAPPGFSIPNRSPPPGFSSNARIQRVLNAPTSSPLFGSSLSSNLYQTPSVENVADMELMDPAILAIGQGRLQNGLESLDNAGLDLSLNFSARFNALENEAKFQQLLTQNPSSPFLNARFSNIGDNTILGNSHGFSSGLSRQSQGTNLSPFSQLSVQHHSRNPPMANGQWDGWNKEVDSGIRLGVANFLGNERMGFNKLYGNYEGSSFGMPSSGDIYNGAYRI